MHPFRNFVFTLLFFQLLMTGTTTLSANNAVNVTATVSACQDGIKGNQEECDLNDFGGQSCATFGFFKGILNCNNDCTINTSQCFSNPSVSSGGYLIKPPTSTPISPVSPVSPEDQFIFKCFKENPLTYLECLFTDPIQEFKSTPSLSPSSLISPEDEQTTPVSIEPSDSSLNEKSHSSVKPPKTSIQTVAVISILVFLLFRLINKLLQFYLSKRK